MRKLPVLIQVFALPRSAAPTLIAFVLVALTLPCAGETTYEPVELTLPLRAIWHTEAGQVPLSSWRAPLGSGVLILPTTSGVEARDGLSGGILWRSELAPLSPRCGLLYRDLVLVGGVSPEGAPDLVALDARDGAVRYGVRLGGVFVAPVPASGGFVAVSTHALAAFDSAGNRVWQVDFPRTAEGYPGGPAFSRPALVGELVIVGAADGKLHAYRSADGSAVWSVALPRPLLSGVATDGAQAIVSTRGAIIAFDGTGTERWRHSVTGDPAFATPAIADGVVYVATGTGGAVLALAGEDGRFIWQRDLGADCFSHPAVARDHVLVGDMTNRLVVLEREGGRIAGAWPLAGAGGVYLSDPVLAAGLVGVGTADGTYQVLAPAVRPAGAPESGLLPLAPNPFTSEIRSGEAAAGGELLIFDVSGRLRRRIEVAAGARPSWDGMDGNASPLPAGVYFLRFVDGPHARSGKAQLVR